MTPSESDPSRRRSAATLSDGTTVRVRSGHATEEELAAIVAAVEQALAADRADERRSPPGWLQAARREALGFGPVASPADLR